jgi:hypothetical protein
MRAALLIFMVVVLGGLLLLVGTHALLPWDDAGGARGRSLLDALAQLGQEHERGDRLDTLREAAARCIEGKRRTVAEVLAGRADLLQAAAAFRDWQGTVPCYDWDVLYQAFPGNSKEESLCLAVIFQVEQDLENRPSECATWGAKLRTQLRLHLERGTLRLPDRTGS